LLWLNGQHIRALNIDQLYERVADFWPESAATARDYYKKEILALVQDRLKTLADVPLLSSYFFERPTPNWTMIDENKQLSKFTCEELVSLLGAATAAFEDIDFDAEAIQEALNILLETTGQKPGILFSLIRLSVSWAPFSPALNETLAALGKAEVITRITESIAASTAK